MFHFNFTRDRKLLLKSEKSKTKSGGYFKYKIKQKSKIVNNRVETNLKLVK